MVLLPSYLATLPCATPYPCSSTPYLSWLLMGILPLPSYPWVCSSYLYDTSLPLYTTPAAPVEEYQDPWYNTCYLKLPTSGGPLLPVRHLPLLLMAILPLYTLP